MYLPANTPKIIQKQMKELLNYYHDTLNPWPINTCKTPRLGPPHLCTKDN
jgi:hypothetical protein